MNKVVLAIWLVMAQVAMAAEPVILIDGKPIKGNVRIEITTEQVGVASPTGREPRILWSRQWQARWQKARDENHPWYQWLAGGAQTSYYDKELSPALMYQITGDTAYARAAWTKLATKMDPAAPPSSDGLRASFVTWLVLHEWLYPALTDAERTTFGAFLDRCCVQASNVSLGDSDRVMGYYFGVAIWASLGSDTAKGVLDSDHFGGLTLRDDGKVSCRTQLTRFAVLAKGGEWIEGTQYNRGTVPTFLHGLDSLRSLGIVEPFADLWAVAPDFATAAVHRMSGDLKAQWNWGATQDLWVHSVSRYDFLLPGWAVMAELGDSNALRNQIVRVGEKGGYAVKPRADFYLYARPEYKPDSTNHTAYHVVPGQQMLYARSGDTFCGFRCGRNNQVHHHTMDAGNFQVWRRGEWVLTHPWIYDDLGTVDGRGGNNSLLVGNQPLNFERREMIGAGAVNGCYYMVLATGGPWRNGQDAAEYLHSHTRWLVWLPGESDVVLIRDVLDVSQPIDQRYSSSGRKTKAYNLGAAWDRHAAYIESRLPGATTGPIPLVQWVIHAPEMPGNAFPGFKWQTAGGQTVHVNVLKPDPGMSASPIYEKELYAGIATWKVEEKERKWQLRTSPIAFEGGKIELLHAVTIGEPIAVSLDGMAVKVGARRVEFTEAGVVVK